LNTLDYLDLIPCENRNKPRFRAWLSSCLGIIKDITDCAASMQKAFSVDDAIGKQLDIVGAYAGASRKLPFQPVESSRYLSDPDYRKLIRATIAQNQWDGTNETLPHLLSSSFPEMGIIISDNQDMSINAVVRGTFTTLQLEMLNADLLLPRPAGVSMMYEVPTEIQETQVPVHGGLMITSNQAFEEA
jgi:hypothetical protein